MAGPCPPELCGGRAAGVMGNVNNGGWWARSCTSSPPCRRIFCFHVVHPCTRNHPLHLPAITHQELTVCHIQAEAGMTGQTLTAGGDLRRRNVCDEAVHGWKEPWGRGTRGAGGGGGRAVACITRSVIGFHASLSMTGICVDHEAGTGPGRYCSPVAASRDANYLW